MGLGGAGLRPIWTRKETARRAAAPNTTLGRRWAPGVPPVTARAHSARPSCGLHCWPLFQEGKQRGRTQGSSFLNHPCSSQNKGAAGHRPRGTAHLGERRAESTIRSETSLLKMGHDCPERGCYEQSTVGMILMSFWAKLFCRRAERRLKKGNIGESPQRANETTAGERVLTQAQCHSGAPQGGD